MTDGRAWISSLGPGLERHRRALADLVDFCEQTPEVSSFSVGCSLGRGVADELSDIDAAVGVAAERGAAGAPVVQQVENALVDLVRADGPIGLLREETSTSDLVIRRLFVQRSDGVQLDLAVIAESEVRREDAAPDFVAVYRADGVVEAPPMPSAYDVSSDQVRTWAFLGWRALLDADKYLRRGSAWEAHERLEQARHRIWQLWAAAGGASYPWHGLSQVLDHDPTSLPAGIESTVAGLDLADLSRAVLACVDALDEASAAAARREPAPLPTDLAAYARRVVAGGARQGPEGPPSTTGRGPTGAGRSSPDRR